MQLGGQRILIDPVFSTYAAPIPEVNKAFEGTSLYTADDIPEIDALLISHDHYDHLDYPTVQALQPKVRKVIVGLGVGAHFERWGYDMGVVREADWNEVIALTPNVRVHVTTARHYSGRTFTRDQSLWVGFALLSPEQRLFFSVATRVMARTLPRSASGWVRSTMSPLMPVSTIRAGRTST
ncbi:MBL fold metallo-hydrolase [Pseudomonas lini]